MYELLQNDNQKAGQTFGLSLKCLELIKKAVCIHN